MEFQKEAVGQDEARHSLTSHLIRQVMNSSKKQELLLELLLEEGRTFAPGSEQSKNIVKEQSNVEAIEVLERTNKEQCH